MTTPWTRLTYFAHRWIGTILGFVVFTWFASGVAMLYHPSPLLTESGELAILPPFDPESTLIGFPRAWTAARASGSMTAELVSGRLQMLGDRPVYQFRRDRRDEELPAVLVDGRSGAVLSPVSPALAEVAARGIVGAEPQVVALEFLSRGDHYMMNGEYAPRFPAYRVRFDDSRHTAVYVSRQGGDPFGVVTRLTRFTTWTGTVPHWFYFRWLYDRFALWNGAIVFIASAGVLLGLTGLVWSTQQLLPRRRGGWLGTYRGISRWHHLTGIFFGIVVVTWCLSGIWENLGSGTSPRPGHARAVRGGITRWDAVRLTEAEALARLRSRGEVRASPVAIDLLQLDGRPGFEVHWADGRSSWVDAGSGESRGEIPEALARAAATRTMGDSVPIQRVERITAYDDYYYAWHGRELHLPAWRVTFGDREASRLYLDAMSGRPTAFVDAGARRSRWWRDALHSLDFRWFADRRPLWDIVMLTLLAGGLLSSGTGLVLAVRRWRRAPRRGSDGSGAPRARR